MSRGTGVVPTFRLMSIHEHLPAQARKQLKEVGWSKGMELAKLARRDGQHFDCATWLHRAREMPKKQFKQKVEKELTGRETEPWESIYFKLYQSQMPVIERTIETAALIREIRLLSLGIRSLGEDTKSPNLVWSDRESYPVTGKLAKKVGKLA
jgi:uncharacterized protein (UPF0216 family)